MLSRTRDLLSRVDRINASMRRLLEVLQDRESSGAEIENVWSICDERTQEFHEAVVGMELTAEESLRIQEGLETTARLNAVAVGMIQSERNVLAEKIRRTRDTQKVLQGGGIEVSPGASCDVAG